MLLKSVFKKAPPALRTLTALLIALAAVAGEAASAEAQDAEGEPRLDAPYEAGDVVAEPPDGAADVRDADLRLRALTIEMSDEDRFRTAGAVTRIDERQLRRSGYDDPTAVATQAPGVFVRTEDGFGLRPNIGIRGANSERSKKITLMEDGVLFGPAPYSAPAAYYFPLMLRMTAVDVYKGPAAVLFGPHTVGGALDLTSRDIPEEARGGLEASLGTYAYGRLHLHYGASNRWGGFLVELARIGTDGFKHVDGSDEPTGFARTEGVVRLRLQTDQDARVAHRFDLRATVSHEVSNETYLGLTDADFRADPYRRYAASQLDRMRWTRGGLQLVHRLFVGQDFELVTTAYRHELSRLWNRFNSIGSRNAFDVLLSPTGARQVYYDVLRGAADSERIGDDQVIYVANNGRQYVSQGLQSSGRLRLRTGAVGHDARLGLRLHYDEADYEQTETGYFMESMRLVPTGRAPVLYSDVLRSSTALSGYVAWAFEWKALRVTPGVRVEAIDGRDRNRASGVRSDTAQLAVLPALGLNVAANDRLSLLAGVYRGFSPVAPGQGATASPEYAVNYEAGARYRDDGRGTLLEVIGFFNDYTNLTGECSFAAGCTEIDRQFDGGRVWVWGAELAAAHTLRLGGGVTAPLRAVYTYTGSRFRTAFESENPQFGRVRVGDELPYVPAHQAAVMVGLEREERWGMHLAGTFVAPMREQAGQGEEGLRTDAQYLVDVTGSWRVLPKADLTLRLENVLLQDPIGSRRPFGARPVRPFQVQVGVRVAL
jgi:Fe(3+) dicitrate transport protein